MRAAVLAVLLIGCGGCDGAALPTPARCNLTLTAPAVGDWDETCASSAGRVGGRFQWNGEDCVVSFEFGLGPTAPALVCPSQTRTAWSGRSEWIVASRSISFDLVYDFDPELRLAGELDYQ